MCIPKTLPLELSILRQTIDHITHVVAGDIKSNVIEILFSIYKKIVIKH